MAKDSDPLKRAHALWRSGEGAQCTKAQLARFQRKALRMEQRQRQTAKEEKWSRERFSYPRVKS